MTSQGVVGLCVGAAVLAGLAPLGPPLISLIAWWATIMGALDLALARAARDAGGARALRVAAVASLVFGAAVLIGWPGAGLVAFIGSSPAMGCSSAS